MIGSGKRFEDNIRLSVPKNCFYYRFRDSSNNWNRGEFVRFTPSNIADCIIFNGKNLFLCELKSHKGSSIPLSCIVGNKTKEKQIMDLINASKFDNLYSYLIVFFEEKSRCFALDINKYQEFVENNDRKSVPLDFFEKNGLEIPVKRLQTNFRYDLSEFLQ